jgi:Protein kinase domain
MVPHLQRLPTKSTPVVPTLTDISFAPSHTVLPRTQPIQSADPSGPRLMTGVGGNGRLAAAPTDEPMQVDPSARTEPPLGNMRNVRLNGSVRLNRSKPLTLKQFFPDAAESEPSTAPDIEPKTVDSSAMLPPPVPARAQAVLPSPAATPKPPQPPLSVRTSAPPVAQSVPPRSTGSPSETAVQKTPTATQVSAPQASKEAPTPAIPIAATQSSQVSQATSRMFKPSRTEIYKIITQVGEGTFGKVYKARNQLSGDHVALKRIRMEGERDGFPVTAMREVKLLQSLRHENVVKLHEMMVSKGESIHVDKYGRGTDMGVNRPRLHGLRIRTPRPRRCSRPNTNPARARTFEIDQPANAPRSNLPPQQRCDPPRPQSFEHPHQLSWSTQAGGLRAC